MATIDLYQAVSEMRRVSVAGGTFSIRFRKWDRQRRRGGDQAYIARARTRPAPADESVENASMKLYLTDTDTGRALNCWQCLVMEYNGQKTILT